MIVHGYRPWGKALTDIRRRKRAEAERQAMELMEAVQLPEVELKFPTASGKPVKGVPIVGIEATEPMAAAMTLRDAKHVQNKIEQAGLLYSAVRALLKTAYVHKTGCVVDRTEFDLVIEAMKGCQDE